MTPGARKYFADLWDALPDHDAPPTEGPFYRGDICKVRGKAMVWLDDHWSDAQEVSQKTTVIELVP